MKIFSIVKGAVITLVLSVIGGVILLMIAFLLPADMIRNNVEFTSDSLAEEQERAIIFPGVLTSGVDNYTDAAMLNASLFGTGDGDGPGNIIRYALEGDLYLSDEAVTMTGLLPRIFDPGYADRLSVVPSFKRFWNGYLLPLKVCLLSMHYYEIRYLNLVVQLVLMGVLCGALYRRKLAEYAIPAVLAYVWLNPATISLCLTFSAFYYCTVIPCILMLAFHDKLNTGNRYLFWFEGIGICTVYFCFNYTQLLALIFPLTLYILLCEGTVPARELVKKCLWLAFFWCFGYYGMMAAKWVVYGIFIDWGIFGEIINNVLFRLSSDYDDISFTRADAVMRNINIALTGDANNLTEGCFILICLTIILRKHKARFSKAYPAVFALSCLIPLARYFVFANHVYIHYWEMYKLLVIPVFCLNVILTRMVTEEDKNEIHREN